mmetsp:Transcript_41928/g.103234  ORF Transcript_41928/g.103234 Transcript_41928/m.103234 type:complete len:433 (-) Transcript_41928:216-1514(-)
MKKSNRLAMVAAALFAVLTFAACTAEGAATEGLCRKRASEEAEWTKVAQAALHAVNHPTDCSTAPLLLCNTMVRKFQGTGSRLFFLGRCLSEGLKAGRAVVLTNDLPSSHDMLEPFKPWSNCTLEHSRVNANAGGDRVQLYTPMDAPSLERDHAEAPGAGSLVPGGKFAAKGYWWWKAQEITYALRPKAATMEAFKAHLEDIGWVEPVAAFQVRRTDKTEGCAKHYGKGSPIKCAAEARAPQLKDFVDALNTFRSFGERKQQSVAVVTDDPQMKQELDLENKDSKLRFLEVRPAPKRVADKAGKGGVFKGRALKDAIDILTLSRAKPLIFTYSSGFGALALQLKQTRENFCSDWASLDVGKREWPQLAAIGEGGVRGMKFHGVQTSKLCYIPCNSCDPAAEHTKYPCSVDLIRRANGDRAAHMECSCKEASS